MLSAPTSQLPVQRPLLRSGGEAMRSALVGVRLSLQPPALAHPPRGAQLHGARRRQRSRTGETLISQWFCSGELV